jgi:hypothetical protein
VTDTIKLHLPLPFINIVDNIAKITVYWEEIFLDILYSIVSKLLFIKIEYTISKENEKFITVTFKITNVLNKPLFTITCSGMNRG